MGRWASAVGGSGGGGTIPGGSCFIFTGRSKICSPVDGQLQFTNNAGTGFDLLKIGTDAGIGRTVVPNVLRIYNGTDLGRLELFELDLIADAGSVGYTGFGTLVSRDDSFSPPGSGAYLGGAGAHFAVDRGDGGQPGVIGFSGGANDDVGPGISQTLDLGESGLRIVGIGGSPVECEYLLSSKRIIAVTSGVRIIDHSEGGTYFTNTGATGTVTFNLPSSVDGDNLGVVVGVASRDTDLINIAPAFGDSIQIGNQTTTGNLSTVEVGASVVLVGVTGNVWQAMSVVGTWTV